MTLPALKRSLLAAPMAAAVCAGTMNSANPAALEVAITSLPSDAGLARIILVSSQDEYEGKAGASIVASVPVNNGKAHWRSDNMAPGDYALIVHHDPNANNELDRPLFGLPFEPYGFSNNAWTSFGVPSWDEVRFSAGGEPAVQEIAVHANPIASALTALRAGLPSLLLIGTGLAGLLVVRKRSRASADILPTDF